MDIGKVIKTAITVLVGLGGIVVVGYIGYMFLIALLQGANTDSQTKCRFLV